MSAPSLPPSVAAVASDAPPKPVAPAEAIPQAPSAALDPIANSQPGFLEKARETILPIVEKVQTTTKPYTDAAAVKAQQFVDKLEGNPQTVQAEPTLVRDIPVGTSGTASTSTSTLPTTHEAAEKAKGVFEQVSSAVQSTFTQITNTIETKTTTDTHPGLITQVQNAVATGQKKIDAFLDQPVGATPAVQTTTNSVPHPVSPEDPKTGVAAGVPVASTTTTTTTIPVAAIVPPQ